MSKDNAETLLDMLQGELASHLQAGVEEADGTVRVYQSCLRDWHTAVQQLRARLPVQCCWLATNYCAKVGEE